MRSPLKLALVAAVPFEMLNFCLLSFREGEAMPHHWLPRLLANQWLMLHWLGILTQNAVDRMGSSALWQILAFMFCGYCETVVLLAVLLFALRGLWHQRTRHSGAIHSHASRLR